MSGLARERRETAASAGKLAGDAWLLARCLRAPGPSWQVEVSLDDPRLGSRFDVHIGGDEWGFRFSHVTLESWVRVSDVPFVHSRDDFALLTAVPPLRDLGTLLRQLERLYGLRFQRQGATIATSIPGSEPAIRSWLHGV